MSFARRASTGHTGAGAYVQPQDSVSAGGDNSTEKTTAAGSAIQCHLEPQADPPPSDPINAFNSPMETEPMVPVYLGPEQRNTRGVSALVREVAAPAPIGVTA